MAGYQRSPRELPSQSVPRDRRFISIIGQTFQNWTVISYAGKPRGSALWNCHCVCGTPRVMHGQALQAETTESNCGCIKDQWDKNHLTLDELQAANEIIDRPEQIEDLAGFQSGRLTAVGFAGRCRDTTWWWCDCSCGTRSLVCAWSLKSELTKSCGCLVAELTKQRMTTHGRTLTKQDSLMLGKWHAMIARCHKPKCKGYEQYGARGIQVCQRWRDSVDAFIEDMGYPPTPEHSLDRYPDQNGNYEPGNVRWATTKQQNANTRRNVNVTMNGRTMCLRWWCDELGLNYGTIQGRIKNLGWEPVRALTTPVKSKR